MQPALESSYGFTTIGGVNIESVEIDIFYIKRKAAAESDRFYSSFLWFCENGIIHFGINQHKEKCADPLGF